MKRGLFTLAVFAAVIVGLGSAEARRVRGARENIAGGVTAGAAEDVSGPFGGRVTREGGVVTNGDGAGLAGSRGCGHDAAGGQGCRRGATAWDGEGNVSHESGMVFDGPLGATGGASGSWNRDENGGINGSRSGELNVGDRTYSAETSVESGEGVQRNVECNGCR